MRPFVDVLILAPVVVAMLAGPAMAQPSPQQLLKAWDEASFNCSGSTQNEQWRSDECARAAALRAHLNDSGWCYGKKGEAQYQKKWHRCGAASLIPNDLITSPTAY
ncbi:hypothetical protein [Methylobacterium aerolatum]|uniref:YARHG domain-containing protein n=1 Tax=Methylobacterium aerolatum TaxID=418708 RepID=A0ABU0I859_9HYPH|nr:hypothetical protein [Methylobacterium aerolatum]MDQ0449834.1 hypothetical protein [Methylobacterium aerolatum]GJD36603.1 hypothetical protein FMGBMHLM_3526 [Methylobacterium aerolatum]